MVVSFILLLLQVFQPRFVTEANFTKSPDTLISKVWTVEDGLPVNTVNSIVQDKKGYLWFTTYDGIVRFDGLDFEIFNYSNTPGLPQNRAVFVHLQKNVGIWVTLENGGVILIDEQYNFHHFNEDEGFTSANTTFMMEDSENRMWFSTFEGLYQFSDGDFKRVINRDAPNKNRISFTYEDVDGSVWVATHDGLVHIQGEEQTVYNVAPGEAQNEFRRIQRFENGELLVSALEGLYLMGENGLYVPEKFSTLKNIAVPYLYQDKEIALISTDFGLYNYDGILSLIKKRVRANSYFWKFYRDSNDILWLVNTQGELFQLKKGLPEKLADTGLVPGFYYNNILEDREKNIWLGTARNGILRLKKSQVQTIGKEEGLTGENILGLFEDSRGRFWIGTRDFGLNVIDGNKITQYREADLHGRDIVHTINEDFEGNVWVGYYQGGIDCYGDSKVTPYDLGFAAGVNDVRSIFIRSDSTIWLGTYGGLVKFDPENENHTIYTEEDGLSSNLIRYIDEGKNGGLWIATMSGGVSYFNHGEFTNYTVDDGLASNNIRSVYVDEYDPGTIWVGTENNGLSRIKNGRIHSVGTDEGLPDHAIHYISQDHLGWLWMSSNRGIFKIHKQNLNDFLDNKTEFFDLIHFGREEGMVNPEANGSFQQGGLRTSNNTFWFATQEGVAIFDIEPNQTNQIPPAILINNLWANGEKYNPGNIELPPGIQAFEVNFRALTFVSPEKTRYRYRLAGFEEEWHEVINERSANYTNIPPGEYIFQVTAANNDGIWNEEAASATISITPAFYQRAWFYILIGLLIVGGYYSASRIRYRYLMRQQEKLKQVIENQTAELRKEKNQLEEKSKIIEQQAKELEESNKTKDKFFSLIAHDLRNPFQAILGYSELMLSDFDEANPDELKSNLEHIHTSAKSLLTLVERLLNWASLHTGKIKPSPEQVNLKELVERVHQLFDHIANQKNIELHSYAEDDLYMYADLNMMQTVLRNLVSNAIKFTREGGEVSLKLYQKGAHYFVEIEDNGVGMSQNLVDKLLRLDANTSRSGTNNEKGTGLGLLICKEMVELHSGEILVESEVNTGTKFTLSFPKEGISTGKKVPEIAS